MKALVLTVILPMFDNDGNDVSSNHKYIMNKVMSESGGLTQTSVAGLWLDANTGNVYTDVSIKIETVLLGTRKGLTARIKAIRNVVLEAKTLLRQEAMFFSISSTDIEFL